MVDLYIANGFDLKKAYLEVYGVQDRVGISYPYRMIKLPEV